MPDDTKQNQSASSSGPSFQPDNNQVPPINATSTTVDQTPSAESSTSVPPTSPQPSDTVSDKTNTKEDHVAPETVITSPHATQKYGGGKFIATIFGVLILVAAVAVAVYFVQREQDLRQKAASGSICEKSPDCILLNNPGNSGTYTAPRSISKIYITAQEYHEFNEENDDNGCYRVSINGSSLQWQRYGEGSNCKDVSNVQVWLGGFQPSPTFTPQISASCGTVKTYDLTWTQLSESQLGDLSPGDAVKFSVAGTASSGSFDKAKFTINGSEVETSTLRPGTDEFYVDYEIPEGVATFTIDAQVHHIDLGWF